MDHRRPLFLRIWGLIALIVGAVWLTASILLLDHYGWGDPKLQTLLLKVAVLTAAFLLAGSILASLTAGRLARKISDLKVGLAEALTREQDLIRVLPVATMRLDRDLRIQQANPAAGMLLGFEEATLEGRSLYEFLTPTAQSDWMARLARIEEVGLALGPMEIIARGGRHRITDATLEMTRGRDLRMSGFTAILQDRTDQQKVEDRLKQSLTYYSRLFQRSALGMVVTGPEGMIRETNPAYLKRFLGGRPQGEVVGQANIRQLHPGLDQKFRTRLEALLSNGTPLDVECWMDTGAGSRIHVQVQGIPTLLEGGSVRQVLWIFQDHTTRRRTLEELQKSEERSRFLLDDVTDVIFELDRRGTWVYISSSVEPVLGWEPGEMVGRTIGDFLHQESRADLEARIRQSKHERIRDFSLRFLHRDGRYLYMSMNAHRHDGIRGTLRDITQSRQLEAELRQSQKMETVGTLAGGIAHDFNNQLTAIIGNLGFLMDEVEESHPFRRELEDSERAAQRCAEMTRSLLAFSRRIRGTEQSISLNDLIHETERLLRRIIPATIEIKVSLHPDLSLIRADPTQIQQVLMNLCVNARDAMSKGGQLTIETSNRVLDEAGCTHSMEARPGEFVVLTVADTGIGMKKEVLSRIFEPFYTTKGVGQGTGLGLAMVYGIVQAHGGWIYVYSEPGKGSLFELFLPKAGDRRPEQLRVTSDEPARGGAETILVADDEQIVRRIATRILESKGYRVLLAEDGEQAVEVFRQERRNIHAVILDLTMPKLSGREAMHQMLELEPKTRIILSSGYSLDLEESDGFITSARAFVQKPYRPEELAQAVRAVLDESEPE